MIEPFSSLLMTRKILRSPVLNDALRSAESGGTSCTGTKPEIFPVETLRPSGVISVMIPLMKSLGDTMNVNSHSHSFRVSSSVCMVSDSESYLL